MYQQFASDQWWPGSFFRKAFQTIKTIALISLLGTNAVSFGMGLYAGKKLGEMRFPRIERSTPVPKEPSSTSQLQRAPKDELSAKANALGVNEQFLMDLSDDVFRAQRPWFEGSLTDADTPAEAQLRQEWWQTVDATAQSLEQLDISVRRNLGNYNEQDFQLLIQQADNAGVSKARFQRRVNARLDRLFPALKNSGFTNSESGKPLPKFSVWCAIAQEYI